MKINKSKLYLSMEIDFENGCGIIDSLERINKVPKKEWKKVLEDYKKWELKKFGENAEWCEEELEERDVKFIKENKIKWNWMD